MWHVLFPFGHIETLPNGSLTALLAIGSHCRHLYQLTVCQGQFKENITCIPTDFSFLAPIVFPVQSTSFINNNYSNLLFRELDYLITWDLLSHCMNIKIACGYTY